MRGDGGEIGLAMLLTYSERKLAGRLLPHLDRVGITLEQWRVMTVLVGRSGVPMAELADAAVLPAASLTRNMDRLVERGLVVRRVDPRDRRKVVATLSPVGARVAADVRALEAETEKQIIGRLGQDQFDALSRELGKLDDILD